ncbi:MAG: PRC-barrel domain-containing protein [Armatimonadota bacterium]|nr:PRC-barrel domain-containing protein [Armatimonadota bacterium]
MDNSTTPAAPANPGDTLSVNRLGGMPVVLLTNGEKQGDVDKVFVSSTEHRLIGLTVHRGGGLLSHGDTFLLRGTDVRSFGKDAITVADPSVLQKTDRNATPFVQEAGEPAIGKPVMTESGKAVGQITDIRIDASSLNIVSYELTGSFIQNISRGAVDVLVQHVVSIGKDVMVIKDVI